MTYPEVQTKVQSQGLFTEDTPEASKMRERLVAIAMEWFQTCQSLRNKQEKQWQLNLAFLSGNQFVQFRQTAQNGPYDLYTPKAPYYTVRITINQVRRIIRKEISRLTAQKPNAYVIPASTEDSDVFAAQAGEQIWDSLWRRLKFNRVLREAVFWQAVCGNGFIKTYWDKDKIDPDNPETPGDICIDNVTPFHIFVPDLMNTEIEHQPYVIHAQVRSMNWIKQNLGIDPSNNAKLESVDDGLLTVLGVNRADTKKETAVVLEVWVKPGYLPDLPKGAMFTIAADQVVQGTDSWPFEGNQYPFAKLDSIPTGKFYTASIIEDLIPLQKELNRTRGQLIEAKNRMAKPQLVAQEGSIDPKRITSEPGQIIPVKVGFDYPQPLPLQNLPSYVTEEINRLYTDMSDISGQHEVSNGSTPPGVTAATAISFLQEQDESLIAGHYTSIEEAVEKVAAQSLNYVKTFWDEGRTVKIVGLEGTFDVQVFKNSDLKGNGDIRVESGSSLPTSRAAKQAFIMDLMKMGFITPQEGLEFLEIGGLNRIYERIQVDRRQAQRENLKMRVITEEQMIQHQEEWQTNTPPEKQVDPNSGMQLEAPLMVPVNTWDNHALHIEEHNRYRKSQYFESAPSATKMLFEEHVKQHQEALAVGMIHPLTGMGPEDPNAPPDGMEQDIQQQQQGNTGPEPMPQLEGDQQPPEGAM